MNSHSQTVSPKQVARAIGVSESSLKRWCDQGLIKTVRTAGGHRKMLIADVLQFIRERDHPLAAPEVLGLPPASDYASLGLQRGKTRLADALLAGDELLALQIVFDLFVAKHPLAAICDEVIASAFHEIGDRWACNQADVYQERRGCEIAARILRDLRKLQTTPRTFGVAIGGTLAGDLYSLPSAMSELILRDLGFDAMALGTSIPSSSLVNAIRATKPAIFWLSVSHIPDGSDFLGEFSPLAAACTDTGAALVVGGRALTENLRQQMDYSAFCDTMRHLEKFAKTLIRSATHSDSITGRRSPAPAPEPTPKESQSET